MDIDKMDKKELIDKISDEIISKLKKTSSSDNLSFKSDLGNKNIKDSSGDCKIQINTPADLASYIIVFVRFVSTLPGWLIVPGN